MAVGVSLRDLAAMPRRLEAAVGRARIDAIREVKRLARTEAAAVIGGDLRMSGLGRAGARLGVRDRIIDQGPATWQAVVFGTPPGAWAILTDGAVPHTIDRRRRRRRPDRRGPAPLNIGGSPRVGPARNTGGSPAHGTWRRVRARAEVALPAAFQASILRSIRGAR